jgi:RNA polymerase subunit RPABC4/transcription elongation factor Spt4
MNMSASLKSHQENKGGRRWLSEIPDTLSFLSGVLRVMHPHQYQLGRDAMEQLMEREDLHEVLTLWPCIFNGLQIISNRECPIHRDYNTASEWYDLLATFGPYRSAILEMPGLGLRFPYRSGTIVGLCGRMLRHGVSAANGDRICLAQYMRENVQKRCGNTEFMWSTWDYYQPSKP